DASYRARSGKASRGPTLDDTSWGGRTDRSGLRADHRNTRAIWVRQAGDQLPGTGSIREVERQSQTAGTYHQAGEFDAALSVSGSGAGDGAQRSRLAQQIFPPDGASWPKDRESSHGAHSRRSAVLDVA